MKSEVFKLAHQIKSFFRSFSEALRAAWMMVKAKAGRLVRFTFAKETGEVREADAIGGGSLDTCTKGFFRFVEKTAEGAEQWRSFRIERLIFS